MVKDSARKKAARAYAEATGKRYTAAARHTAARHHESGVSAHDVHTRLARALQEAGWPVQAEGFPENVEYRGYAGPVRWTVGRAEQLTSFSGDDDPDPDDGTRLDLSRPPRVEMAAPMAPTGFEVWAAIGGDRPVSEVVERLSGMLADGRAAAVARAFNDVACVVCGDAYPRAHLLAAAGDDRLRVCPACAFDGDILLSGDHASAYLAYQIDRLPDDDLCDPAGWAGPAALLACAAPDGFGKWLHQRWREADIWFIPSASWSDPGQAWMWLPPAQQRPAPLARFGPGARLGTVVAAMDAAWPDLRQRVRTELADSWREAGDLDDEEEVPDSFVERVWPAAVAYAVSLATQAAERPAHRPPLQHLLGSFDALRDHFNLIGSPLNVDDVESTISASIEIITEALGR